MFCTWISTSSKVVENWSLTWCISKDFMIFNALQAMFWFKDCGATYCLGFPRDQGRNRIHWLVLNICFSNITVLPGNCASFIWPFRICTNKFGRQPWPHLAQTWPRINAQAGNLSGRHGEMDDGQVGQKLDNVSLKHSKEGCKLEPFFNLIFLRCIMLSCSTVIYWCRSRGGKCALNAVDIIVYCKLSFHQDLWGQFHLIALLCNIGQLENHRFVLCTSKNL